MGTRQEFAKFLSGVIFGHLMLFVHLWITGQELTVHRFVLDADTSVFAFVVGLFVFVLVTSFAFFSGKRDAIA